MDVYFENARVAVHTGGRDGKPERVLRAHAQGQVVPRGRAFNRLSRRSRRPPRRAKTRSMGERSCRSAMWRLGTSPSRRSTALGSCTNACDDLAAARRGGRRVRHAPGRARRGVKYRGCAAHLHALRGDRFHGRDRGVQARHDAEERPVSSRAGEQPRLRGFAHRRRPDRARRRPDEHLRSGADRGVRKRAEEIAGHAAAPTTTQKTADVKQGWRWQRKLMAGGGARQQSSALRLLGDVPLPAAGQLSQHGRPAAGAGPEVRRRASRGRPAWAASSSIATTTRGWWTCWWRSARSCPRATRRCRGLKLYEKTGFCAPGGVSA